LPPPSDLEYNRAMGKIPEAIGRYEILSLIGRGAMGVVYKARDPYIGRVVAVKRISLGELIPEDRQAEFKQRFFQEARAAGNLNHPNIVTVHDVGEADGIPFMAMEFIDGESLSSLMKSRGALPLSLGVSITRQVALALAYAHERGIIHRDIKPDNILVDHGGRAVVTDFGAARLQSSELTRTGEVLGTPHYMSPEQILGDKLDGRSDLFSLGVVLYLMATAKRPFKGDTISSICYHIVHSAPDPPPPDRRLPREVVTVIQRLLSKSKEGRYASGVDLVKALDALEGSEGAMGAPSPTETLEIPTPPPAPLSATTAGQPPSPPRESPAAPRGKKGLDLKVLLAAAAGTTLIVVLLIGSLALWLLRSPTPEPQPPPPSEAAPSVPVPAAPEEPSGFMEPAAEAPAPPEPEPAGGKPAPAPGAPAPSVAATPKPLPFRPPAPPPPPEPAPDPQVAADAEELRRDADRALALAGEERFREAFELGDTFQARLERLEQRASPADRAAVEGLPETLAASAQSLQRTLDGWAKPHLEKALNTYATATEGVNDDEEGIIRAYVEAYPAVLWKKRLSPRLRRQADDLVYECRENLDEDEWAEAEALARGEPLPED